MNKRELLDTFRTIVEPLAATFGPACEVVLHDLTETDHSIVAIANGHVTGRRVGDPLNDLDLFELAAQNPGRNAIVGYRIHTWEGRSLRSTTLFLRDSHGSLVGALAINYDLTVPLMVEGYLRFLTRDPAFEKVTPLGETQTSVQTLLTQLVDEAIGVQGKTIQQMSKEDRIAIVQRLADRGAFLIRDSVHIVARSLGVSRVAIYTYLDGRQALSGRSVASTGGKSRIMKVSRRRKEDAL